jgi:hypothetical protein
MKKLKKIPKLQPRHKKTTVSLPSLVEFRSTIKVKGASLSKTAIASRNEERY